MNKIRAFKSSYCCTGHEYVCYCHGDPASRTLLLYNSFLKLFLAMHSLERPRSLGAPRRSPRHSIHTLKKAKYKADVESRTAMDIFICHVLLREEGLAHLSMISQYATHRRCLLIVALHRFGYEISTLACHIDYEWEKWQQLGSQMSLGTKDSNQVCTVYVAPSQLS